MKNFLTSFAFFCFLIALSATSLAQSKVALVIGNNAYIKIPPLNNAVNDAASIAVQLKLSGFQVTQLVDATNTEIGTAKIAFLKSLANGGIGVFYYAGHGVQIEGRNYLLPIDLGVPNEENITKQGVSVPKLLDEIEQVRPRLSILILDACRDNPFVEVSSRSVITRGIAEVGRPIPSGTLVIYAASSNQTAIDSLSGNDRSPNGLFTRELLQYMREPGLEIRNMARRVRFSVMEKAQSVGHLQIPALYDNLSAGEFYFAATPQRALAPVSPPISLPTIIKLIVPAAAGSATDGMIRAILPFLSRYLGAPISVENQIDIQGDRVASVVASSPKDGSVLLVSPYIASARRARNSQNQLDPIGVVADVPLTLAAASGVAVSSLSDVVALAKSRRTPLRFTVGLRGSISEMCGHEIRKKLGGEIISLQQVNGDAIAFQQALTGQTDLICYPFVVLSPYISSGKLKAITEISSSASQFTRTLQVSNAGGQGYDIVAPNWWGVFAPQSLPRGITERISAAIQQMQTDPNFVDTLKRFSALPVSAEQASPSGLLMALKVGIAQQ